MMKRCVLITATLVLSSLLSAQPQQPLTPKHPKTFTEHGTMRVDDYFWLSNAKDTAVISHLRQENAYVEAMMKHTEPLQKTLYNELVARIEQRYESLPVKQNGYWYYVRYEEGKQYPLYCRKQGTLAAPEEVFIDANALAQGHQIFLVRGYSVSRDNAHLVYGIDTSGDRRCVAYVRNLKDGSPARAVVNNTSGAYEWANDNATFFYVLNDPTVRPSEVRRHMLGAGAAADPVVYTERDSTFSVGLSSSRHNKQLIVTSGSTLSSECRIIDASHPELAPALIQARKPNLLYWVEETDGGDVYMLTNHKAKNFKLVKAPLANPGIDRWTDVIPHQSDALLQKAVILSDYIIAQRKTNALPQILVLDRRKHSSSVVKFDEEAFVASMSVATDDEHADSIRYTYSSLTQPETDYRYNLRTRRHSVLKTARVGGGYDRSLYETKRLWAQARDGARIPVTIVYKKRSLVRDGSNPMLLYAYGSYGASMEPSFNRSVISLLDRGFVYAIAHIRGGQELGRAWYENGKILNKKNTFNDFIDCAEFLLGRKYSSRERLFINGGSAGGMLMGAVTNMRPDLFRGVIAEVPWMDVITDMFDASLPLTTLEYDEWGSPYDTACYPYMLSWSPYDNVADASYPAIFATGGLNDTQVPYYSPAKWVAKVREHNKGGNPVLFKCNMGAGHGGESGRFERQKLTALKYAFMLDLLGQAK